MKKKKKLARIVSERYQIRVFSVFFLVVVRYAHHYPESLRDGVEVLDNLGMKKEVQLHDFFTFHGNDNENIYVQPVKTIED